MRLLSGQVLFQSQRHLSLDLGQGGQMRGLEFHPLEHGESLGHLHHTADLLGFEMQGGLVEPGHQAQPRDGVR